MIRKYSEMDIDELLSQLNENELEQLVGMVSLLRASPFILRCSGTVSA